MYLVLSLIRLMVSVEVKRHVYLLMYLVFTHMSGESYHKRRVTLLWKLSTMFTCLCTLYLHTCRVRVTISDDSGLCCCACVMSFNSSASVLIQHKCSGPHFVSDF